MIKNWLEHGTYFNKADDQGFDLLNLDISDDLEVNEDLNSDFDFEDER